MVRYTDWVNESWRMFSSQWGGWVAVSLIVLGFNYIAGGLLLVPLGVGYGYLNAIQAGVEPTPVFPLAQMIGSELLGCVMLVFLPPLTAGVYAAAFNQMRTGRLAVLDVFKGMRFFWQTNLYLGVVGVLISLGLMLCFIPGIYLGVCAFFAFPLMVEGRLGFWQAFTVSAGMVKKDFWNFLLYVVLTGIIAGLGSSCVVLILATYPFYFLMRAVAYRDLFGVEGAVAFPPTPPAVKGRPVYQEQEFPRERSGDQAQRAFSFCPRCGAAAGPGDSFCMSCGFGLK